MKLSAAIQRVLMQPSKYDEFQHWRGPGDEPGEVPPSTYEDWKLDWPEDKPMEDIYDGWGGRAVEAGLKRQKGGNWGIEDTKTHNISQCFVSLKCGLLVALNIDWYIFKLFFFLYL